MYNFKFQAAFLVWVEHKSCIFKVASDEETEENYGTLILLDFS